MDMAAGKSLILYLINYLIKNSERGEASLSHSTDGNYARARKLSRNGFPGRFSARFRLPSFTRTRSGRFTQTGLLLGQADGGPDRVHEIR
jgi:hypothetical protein